MTTTDLLLDAIRTATGHPSTTYASEPVPLSGGHWAEMYSSRRADPPSGL